MWVDGWWANARRTPAHRSRVGGGIVPFAAVVHTTDMHPDSWAALVRAYTTVPAPNAATFGIGRTIEDGVVQFASVFTNANHAGGAGHGVFLDARGQQYHPNLASVGIEIHNAGGLRLVAGIWRWGESLNGKPWAPFGAPIPPIDVVPDPARPGRGWHRPSSYQLAMLDRLRSDLNLVLAPAPTGLRAVCRGKESVPLWAQPVDARTSGHVSLDPDHRSDPWPLIMAHVNGRS